MARLGALQIGSSPHGTAATLERVLAHAPAIRAAALDLLVLPEALLGGYPKGADFGARVGYRTPPGREQYLAYWTQAIELDGQEVPSCASSRAKPAPRSSPASSSATARPSTAPRC